MHCLESAIACCILETKANCSLNTNFAVKILCFTQFWGHKPYSESPAPYFKFQKHLVSCRALSVSQASWSIRPTKSKKYCDIYSTCEVKRATFNCFCFFLTLCNIIIILEFLISEWNWCSNCTTNTNSSVWSLIGFCTQIHWVAPE